MFILNAQEDRFITGYAPEFVGEKVTLYTYGDYITLTRVKIGETIVGNDSLFKLKNDVKFGVKLHPHSFVSVSDGERTQTRIFPSIFCILLFSL